MNKRRIWTKYEKDYLINNFHIMNLRDIALIECMYNHIKEKRASLQKGG